MPSFNFRHVLALATLTAAAGVTHPVFAQSAVQLYGLLDVGVGSFEVSGGQRDTRMESGLMTTSFWGVKGEEDLGGGLAALFTFESFLRLDSGDAGRFTNDPLFSRNANVGLRGGFGTVRFGRASTPLFISTLNYNPFGDSFGFSPSIRSFFGSTGKVAGDTGWSNAITWSSPRKNGFGATVQYSLGEDNVSGDSIGANVGYASGPLGLNATIQQVKAVFTAGDETTWQLGASYLFGTTKTYLQYGQVDEGGTTTTAGTPPVTTATRTANTKDKIVQIGASMPLGAGFLLASYATADTSGAADIKRDFLSVGYDYFLAKSTDVYAVLMTDKLSNAERGDNFAVGMRHRF